MRERVGGDSHSREKKIRNRILHLYKALEIIIAHSYREGAWLVGFTGLGSGERSGLEARMWHSVAEDCSLEL